MIGCSTKQTDVVRFLSTVLSLRIQTLFNGLKGFHINVFDEEIEDVLGSQSLELLVGVIQQSGQDLHGLDQVLGEEGVGLLCDLVSLALELGLEGRIFEPVIQRVPAYSGLFGGVGVGR